MRPRAKAFFRALATRGSSAAYSLGQRRLRSRKRLLTLRSSTVTAIPDPVASPLP